MTTLLIVSTIGLLGSLAGGLALYSARRFAREQRGIEPSNGRTAVPSKMDARLLTVHLEQAQYEIRVEHLRRLPTRVPLQAAWQPRLPVFDDVRIDKVSSEHRTTIKH